jgi:hypothetical protein
MKIANHNLKSASDVYAEILRVFNKDVFYTRFAKSQMKAIGVEISFIESAAKILNLTVQFKGNGGIIVS